MPTRAEPFVFFAWRPTTERAADAWLGRAAFLIVLKLAIQNNRRFGYVIHGLQDSFYAPTAATLRTDNDNITRVRPLIIMLTPTKTPIAHTALDGHWK